jgi:MFS family permease
VLRGVDPRTPFVVSTLTLLAAVAGLVYAERRAPALENSQEDDSRQPGSVAVFYLALLLMAVGFQVHFSLNSAPRYLQLATIRQLLYLMPVFWIGFSLAMPGAPALVRRLGALEGMAVAGAVGALAMYCATIASSLSALVVFETLAGASWGLTSVAAYTAAVGFGRTGREGRFLGTLFAVIALAAFARIAAYASDLVVEPEIKAWLPWVPPVAWVSAALLLLAGRSRSR